MLAINLRADSHFKRVTDQQNDRILLSQGEKPVKKNRLEHVHRYIWHLSLTVLNTKWMGLPWNIDSRRIKESYTVLKL